ncbi:branched-chain amino acid ABC transporter ATP-binding protein/permease [Nocardioides zeae]|uniref:Branched-chain amino acid transport system permease protein n=1 Tax=Nocardioides zeae TaxID=1457234 RepID=A0AAJ1X3K3_9ACTN|nr:branched-chain amino acid ABC transporter ATP-binding protein/permease [Nocardioides zeae]MDQ1106489.1 branched-chain amino acid transport system permease protein [Nocardioides zeae]
MSTTTSTSRLLDRFRRGEAARDLGFLGVLLAAAAWIAVPALSGDGTTLAGTQTAAVVVAVAVAAAGLNLLSGHARLISLGQGAFFAIGAYVSAYLSVDSALHPLVAIVVALVVTAAFGGLLALCTMRLRGPAFAMVTLVVAILTERVLAEWAPLGRLSGYPNTLDHGSGLMPPVEVFGTSLEPPLFAGTEATVVVAILVVAVVALVGYRNVARSPWGRSLHAIGTSEHLAAHLGVNVFGRKVAVMALASTYGALGGVFYAQVFAHLQPESFTMLLSITMILAVILGGAGTVAGPLVGAVIIVLLQRTDALTPLVDLQRQVSDTWYLSTPGLIGVLLVLTLAFLPQGIVGGLGELAQRLPGRSAPSVPSVPTAPGVTAREVATVPSDGGGGGGGGDDVLLAVRGVSKSFGGIKAVRAAELVVRRGTIHAVIGPNGAGKTTVANLVTGVYGIDGGEITLDGRRIDGRRTHAIVRAGVARTFQTPLLFTHASATENVLAGFPDTGRLPLVRAWLKDPGQYRRARELRDRAAELLELVGLGADGHVEAGSLPYGKQRALEIARALASDPRLLILDEPAAGLNTAETAELGRLMLTLRARGLAMVVVEHHMDLVTQVSDEVTCMESGAVLAHGTAAQVLAEPAVVEAYLGVEMEETA